MTPWQSCRSTLLAALLCGSVAVGAQTPVQATSPPTQQLSTLEATVNGEASGAWPFVERLGAYFAPREAFEQWRVQIPEGATSILVRGSEYWPLAGVPGFSIKVNSASQSAEISFSAQAFTTMKLSRQLTPRPELSPVLPSVFVNYDLNYSDSRTRGAANSTDFGALTELGFSNELGVFTSSHLGRWSSGANAGTGSGWLRLESTFTRNYPDSNQTLRLGDTSTRAGLWGRSIYFGGIQFGTNFSLSPGYVTQPLPVLRGTSAAPSTVELYVNDVLRQVSNVPPGPFVVENLTALTGSGEARLVVRDILGRETVVVQPFFSSAQLLAPELDDWSIEAGALREQLGTANARYGPGFTSGTWRRGWSDVLTLEARAEAASDVRVVGFGAVAALPGQFLGRVAVVRSQHDSARKGDQWIAGLERQWLRTSANIQVQSTSPSFRSLDSPLANPIRRQVAGNATHSFDGMGTFGIGFASLWRQDDSKLTTISLNYATRIAGQSYLSIYATRVLQSGQGTSIGMSLNIPLEDSRQVGFNATRQAGLSSVYATAAQSADADTNLGWRLLAGDFQGEKRGEGGLSYAGRYGQVFTDVAVAPSQTGLRAGANGGLVLADGRAFATRRVDQSFAVAEVAGYGDIGVGLGTNILARTDASGAALIPQLSPYQTNSVRLNPTELPINAELGSIELLVVPAWRSAVKATFPVRSGRGALIKFTLDDGEPVPAGATVQIQGDSEEFFVARRGEAFVTGLQPRNRLVLKWKEQACAMDVALAASNDEIARLGPIQCNGVRR